MVKKLFAILCGLAIFVFGGLTQVDSVQHHGFPRTGVEYPAPIVPFGGDGSN